MRDAGRIPLLDPEDFFQAMLRTAAKAAHHAEPGDWRRIEAVCIAVREGARALHHRETERDAEALRKRAHEALRRHGHAQNRALLQTRHPLAPRPRRHPQERENVEVLDADGSHLGHTKAKQARKRVRDGKAEWIVAWIPTIRWRKRKERGRMQGATIGEEPRCRDTT